MIRRAFAREAEGERERRTKVIHAGGELQASERLAGGAHGRAGVQLRYLQTLTTIAGDKNPTIASPMPMDSTTSLLDKLKRD
jgi:hypothetical protein